MKMIWIIDEQENYREGIRKLLEISFTDYKVESLSFPQAQDKLHSILPCFVIMDPAFRNGCSSQAIDFFTENNIQVLILTMETESEKVLSMLKKPLSGFLMKNMLTKDLVTYIGYVLAGKRYIHPLAANVLLDEFHRTNN